MGDLLFKQEVYAIIGCAIEVHRTLGSGFLEGVYSDALVVELERKGIPFERERKYPVVYKGARLDRGYVLDLVCYSQIIVELKAIDFLSKQCESQLINYLKVTGLRLGLLINFGSHGTLEWKRMIL
ncbi:MAG: GxxExxY protein [Anaerolineales bacterium]|nr:GxxExxY protein [Anaerolineales bacterium]